MSFTCPTSLSRTFLFPGLCQQHNSLGCPPQGLVQPIAVTATSDPTNCPRCHRAEHEASRRLSVLDSAGSDQEDGGASEGEEEGSQEDQGASALEKEEELEEGGRLKLCSDMWREVRVKLRVIVDSKYFNRGIMIAILVNTISMGIEHHEQVKHLRAQGGQRGLPLLLGVMALLSSWCNLVEAETEQFGPQTAAQMVSAWLWRKPQDLAGSLAFLYLYLIAFSLSLSVYCPLTSFQCLSFPPPWSFISLFLFCPVSTFCLLLSHPHLFHLPHLSHLFLSSLAYWILSLCG